jgi:hypothetical protein
MKPVALAVLICLLSLNSTVGLCAQENKTSTSSNEKSSWERVSRIRSNEKITVQLRGGATLKGKFVQADADSLTLLAKGNTTSKINKGEILRIYRKSAAMGALGGTIAGMGLGAAAGASYRRGDMSRAAIAGIGVGFFGLAGAVVGAIIGINRTFYENLSPLR